MGTLLVWLSVLPFLPAAEISVFLEKPAVRRTAPEFALLDVSGKSVAQSSFRGNPVLLDLWATKCSGCTKEIPYFIDIHQAYARKGLAVVGVSMEILYEDRKGRAEAWRLVKPFVADHNVRYPILMGDDGFTKSYSVTTLTLPHRQAWPSRGDLHRGC